MVASVNHMMLIWKLLSGLEGSAFQSRVPFDKMTQIEAACFPDLVTPVQSQKLYINLRNRSVLSLCK